MNSNFGLRYLTVQFSNQTVVQFHVPYNLPVSKIVEIILERIGMDQFKYEYSLFKKSGDFLKRA